MAEPFAILPDDEHNRVLLGNVRPADHVNPEPDGRNSFTPRAQSIFRTLLAWMR